MIFELKRESSRLVLKKWEDDREVFTLKQVHSSKVHMIDSVGKKLEGDAIITQERGLKIGVRTADCVPVALLGKRTVAVIHAGWRGLKEGIVERTLEKLSKLEPLSGFLAFVGPSAKACCYEVGEEFKEHFLCIHYKNNRHYMDTQEETLLRLKRSGVEDIFLYKLCTVCNHKFPSHRRNGTKERLLTYAELLSE
ncbi:MAG: peptidoglycan editing factor PgeF [Aquificaceae bacterium]|nr:peptidoglycan editing factor PgeF [Aquificaceae bacterium]MCS7307436.1 peptidoglycan editing factor PgeF [Aquificaceae bacterium]MDW8434126.1 peptidoglycan editing factor PgeF [Aquificaceae bacterium]